MTNVPSRILFDLPDFANITASDIQPLTDRLLSRLGQQLQALSDVQSPTFETLVHPHQALLHDLARSWSPISHLNMVSSSDEWQREYLEALSRITEFSAGLSQDRNLFKGYEAVANALPANTSDQQKQVVSHALRDFRLAGVDLDDAGQRRFRELMQSLSAMQAQFANHVQQSSDAWHWHTDDQARISGIPVNICNQAERAASEKGLQGWLFDLSPPVYQAVITHADHQETRAHFYEAWMTRAAESKHHDAKFNNNALMLDILAARRELAQLLGFDSYAEYSIAPKMAGSVHEVMNFLEDLRARSEATAQQELSGLQTLAGRTLEPWDVSYFTERYRDSHFSISDDRLRPYFPVETVMRGVFSLAEQLYGLTLNIETDVSVWHEGVQFLTVTDQDQQLIGGFYTDLIARTGKRGGAWIDECIVRKSIDDDLTLPVGYLVCNFSAPDGEAPSLLTHNDVVTLFHEFGHMLHHLLTRIDYPSIAGINGVPWDAVELPSQFMENFAWHYEVLRTCSGHYESDEQLPREIFDKLLASRNVGAGLQMLRQIEFSTFDFGLHAIEEAPTANHISDLLRQTRQKTALVDVPDFVQFENSFTHIFAGGYAAGYYSYKWAEVLAADAFAAFDESGDIFDQTVAGDFRKHILEIGGSRDIQEAYVDFRGRPAKIDALLHNAGIAAA